MQDEQALLLSTLCCISNKKDLILTHLSCLIILTFSIPPSTGQPRRAKSANRRLRRSFGTPSGRVRANGKKFFTLGVTPKTIYGKQGVRFIPTLPLPIPLPPFASFFSLVWDFFILTQTLFLSFLNLSRSAVTLLCPGVDLRWILIDRQNHRETAW